MGRQLYIDDPLRVNPAALKIVAIHRVSGEREEITDLYWFEENMVDSMIDHHEYEFEITLHDPSSR